MVYTRVVTESSVTLAAGRLGPGEVCFMRKKKRRFHERAVGTGLQQICEMLGLDGANRLLCGEMDGSGFVVGVNVLDLDDPATPTPAAVLPTDDANSFKLDMLDELTLDGVIVSNESVSSFSAQDVVFNVALAGPSNLQNSFSEYTEDGSELKRDSHMTLADRAHVGHGEDHYVGRLTNASIESQQMFDRKAQILTMCCIGLQARFLTTKQKMNLRTRGGELRYAGATKAARLAACQNACACYFTFTPFTSRQAWALQPELHSPPSAWPGKETYDAIRLPDLHSMVGFWTVGKILDTAAAKNGRRARGGPNHAPSLLRVNVDVTFRSGLDQYDHAAAAKLKMETGALPDAQADGGERRRRDKVRAKLGRQARADLLRPSGRTVHGPAFGLAVLGPDAAAFCASGKAVDPAVLAGLKAAAAYAASVAEEAAEKAEEAERVAAFAPSGSGGDDEREKAREAEAEEEVAAQVAKDTVVLLKEYELYGEAAPALQRQDTMGRNSFTTVDPGDNAERAQSNEVAKAKGEELLQVLQNVINPPGLPPPPPVLERQDSSRDSFTTVDPGDDVDKEARLEYAKEEGAKLKEIFANTLKKAEEEAPPPPPDDNGAAERQKLLEETVKARRRLVRGDSSSENGSSESSAPLSSGGGGGASGPACTKKIPDIDELKEAEGDAQRAREAWENVRKGRRGEVNEISEEALAPYRENIENLLNVELTKNFDGGISAIEEVRDMLAKVDATTDDVDILPQVARDGDGLLIDRIAERARKQAENARARANTEGLSYEIKQKREFELQTSNAFVEYLTNVASLRTPGTTEAVRNTYMDAVDAELDANAAGIASILGTDKGKALADFVAEKAEATTTRLLYLNNKFKAVKFDEKWKRVVYAKLIARNEVRTNTYTKLAKILEDACKKAPARTNAAYGRHLRATYVQLRGAKRKLRIARLQNTGYAHFGVSAGLTFTAPAPASRKAPAVRTAASAATPIVEAAAAAAGRSNKSPARKRPVAGSTGAPVTPGAPVRKRPTPGGAASSAVTASVFESVLGSSPRQNAPPSPPAE